MVRGVIAEFVRERDEQLKDAQAVAIELDAVIFDDGTLVGPDEDAKLATLYRRRVGAYQCWLQMIADGLAAEQSVEVAYSPILKFRDDVRARRGSLRGLTADDIEAEAEKTNAAVHR